MFASARSWLAPDLRRSRGAPRRRAPAGRAPRTTTPLVGRGALPARRRARRASSPSATPSFASNHYLRTLYNLDLVLNAVHWALAREPADHAAPEGRASAGASSCPLPLQNTFTMFQGVGLLLPELLLLAAASPGRGRGARSARERRASSR